MLNNTSSLRGIDDNPCSLPVRIRERPLEQIGELQDHY